MKKVRNLILCSLCLLFGGSILLNNSETIVVSNNIKADSLQTGYEIGNTVCLKTEAEAKYYIEQASGQTLKPLLTYKYGDTQAKTDAGDPYYCDNPDVSIKTFNICVFDGYYLDAELTKPVNPTKVGDVLKPLEYIKDGNGCITRVNYLTVLYAKCKSETVTETPTPTPVVTQKVTPTPTTTKIVSKDGGDPVPSENPETGDMILLYAGAAIILVVGCGLALKKITSK